MNLMLQFWESWHPHQTSPAVMGSVLEPPWPSRSPEAGLLAPLDTAPPLLRPSDVDALREVALLQLALDLGAELGAAFDDAPRCHDLLLYEPVLYHLLDFAPRALPRLAATCRATRAFFDEKTLARSAPPSSVEYGGWPPLGRVAARAHRASIEAVLPREYWPHLRLRLRDGATSAALDLFGSFCLAAGAAAITGAILDGADLREINLRGAGLGDDGAALLALSLSYPWSPVETLCLWSNDITSDGCASLAEALRFNTTLTSLDLSGNLIGADGASALTDALALNGCLTSVDLRNNDVDACDPRRRRRVGRRRRSRPRKVEPP